MVAFAENKFTPTVGAGQSGNLDPLGSENSPTASPTILTKYYLCNIPHHAGWNRRHGLLAQVRWHLADSLPAIALR